MSICYNQGRCNLDYMNAQLPIQHILTPETEKLFFEGQILPPLLKGENLSIFWVSHGGVRTQMNFLVQNPTLFNYRKLGTPRFAYIDPNELIEDSAEGYFQLMIYSLDPKEKTKDENKSSFFLLKESVKKILEENSHLVFVLSYFEKADYPPTFFDNLHSLCQMAKGQILFIFIFTKNVFNEENIKKYDQLKELIIQNTVYFPLLTEKDSYFVAENLTKSYGYQIPAEKVKQVLKMIGGHISLIFTALRILDKNPSLKDKKILDFLISQREIEIILEDMWENLSFEEKLFLRAVIEKGGLTSQKADFLLKLGIVLKEGDNYSLFSPLFERFIKSQPTEPFAPNLTINEKTGNIFANGLPPKEKITLNEHRLLAKLLKNPNEIISRDEIAEVLWGKDSFQKYSDWTIDQMISLLRKKLTKLGVSPLNLQTIRNRGYRWVK